MEVDLSNKEEVIAENKQKHAEQNEVRTTFEFETKRHHLSPAKSKNTQYMNTDILIHQGLSLTTTLVKSNREGRNLEGTITSIRRPFQNKRKHSNGWPENLSMDMAYLGKEKEVFFKTSII
eukprot:8306887-Ditylum_brightwellii.AAC.1